MLESILANEQANKAALLLVNERYQAQLAPFVKDSASRLDHVRSDIERIITEVCAEVGADHDYVTSRFNEHLSSAVLVKDHAKREKLKVKKDWPKNMTDVVQTGDIKHTEVDDEGTVPGAGEDEARTPDAHVDLGKDTQKGTFPSEQKRGSEKESIEYRDRFKTPYDREEQTENFPEGKRCPNCGATNIDLMSGTCMNCGAALSQDEQGNYVLACFRCETKLDQRVASLSPVCASCTAELQKLACECGGECDGDCECGGKTAACSCGKGKKKKKDDDYLEDDEAEEKMGAIGDEAFGIVVDAQTGAILGQFLGYTPDGKIRALGANGAQQYDPNAVRIEKAASKQADLMRQPGEPAVEDLANLSTKPVNENLPYQCSICGRQGTQEEILQHVNQDHQDVLERQQNEYLNNPGATTPVPSTLYSSKEAAPADKEEQALVEPLEAVPGDQFDDMVQDLADRAAAIQFSTLEDKDLNALAEQLGLTGQDLAGKVQVVATFGNYVGVNGQLSNTVPDVPEGFQEVQAQQVRATAHEALIPTNVVINKVAEQMNMPEDLAYNMVKDKYGDDLPDKYHAAVQGEYHFYVPASLANNTSDVAADQGTIGPTMQAPNGDQFDQPPVPAAR